MELPYEPAIPLLEMYLKEVKNTMLKSYLKPQVHSNVIYSRQDTETT